ncbi:MAG: MFS transporter [Anaerolineae bacterium]
MSATYVRMLRLFSRDLRLFLVTAVLVGLAWDGVRAVLFNLYLLRLGYGPESVGVVNSAGALVFGLVCPLAGAMGTRWGSRQVLIVGMGVLAAGFGLLPVVEYLPEAWRMAWLLATSMLTYLGFALYLVNGLPFLMAVTGAEERNYAFSVHMALAPLAAFAGSLLGGWLPGILARGLGLSLAEAAPYRYPLLLAAVLLVPGVLVMLPTRSGDGPPVPRLTGQELEGRASSIPWGLLVIIGLIMALRFGGRGTVTTFFNVYMDEGLGVPTALIGILSAAGQLLSVPAALAAPLLVVRWGNPRIVSWGMIGMALLLLPLALVPQWAAAGLGFVSSTALFSVTVGPIRVFSQELVAPRWRASMASAFMMGAGLAFSMVSLAGGYAIVALGYRAVFLAAAGLAAAGGLLFFAYFHVPRGEMSPPSPLNIVE